MNLESLKQALRELEIVKLWRASMFRTVAFRARIPTGDASVYLYPEVFAYAARTARIEGNGRLDCGSRWKHTRFYPSQLQMLNNSRICLGGDFRFETGFSVSVKEGAVLRLGSGYLNNHGVIECYTDISIGNGVFIASNVVISDSDQHALSHSGKAAAPIAIGDHVWIGEGVKILKGVAIGDGAVVAAGAIVTRDVPPRALCAGVPARVIRGDVSWK